ncbi:MAG: hypothetical protein F4Y39_24835 [Gemmatimonadetes bacterium]|nr:hypothetical protein [Gemmatimonadota bacterium]MYF79173.1 hypothetical protein [Chloroflexota bacterium]
MSFFLPLPAQGSAPGSRGGGGEFRVLLENSDLGENEMLLQGETDTYDLPAPPTGKKYEYIAFDFLCAIDTLTVTPDNINTENRSSGQFIHDSTGDHSSWYRSFYIGSDGQRWYSGSNTEITDEVTTMAVGVVHVRSDTYVWTVEYNPTSHQLSFWRGGDEADTNNNPIVYAALITAFVV